MLNFESSIVRWTMLTAGCFIASNVLDFPRPSMTFAMTSTFETLEPTSDSLDVVKKNIKDGKAVLVDVRSLEETNKGYVKGAVRIPVQSLTQSPDKEKIRKALQEGKIVYTYCVVGKRAMAAGQALEKLGYDARPLKEGYKELIKAGFEEVK